MQHPKLEPRLPMSELLFRIVVLLFLNGHTFILGRQHSVWQYIPHA